MADPFREPECSSVQQGSVGPSVALKVRRGDIFRGFSGKLSHIVKMSPYVEVFIDGENLGTADPALNADLQPVWNYDVPGGLKEFQIGQELQLRVLNKNNYSRKDVVIGSGSVRLSAQLLAAAAPAASSTSSASDTRVTEQTIKLYKDHPNEKPELTGNIQVCLSFTPGSLDWKSIIGEVSPKSSSFRCSEEHPHSPDSEATPIRPRRVDDLLHPLVSSEQRSERSGGGGGAADPLLPQASPAPSIKSNTSHKGAGAAHSSETHASPMASIKSVTSHKGVDAQSSLLPQVSEIRSFTSQQDPAANGGEAAEPEPPPPLPPPPLGDDASAASAVSNSRDGHANSRTDVDTRRSSQSTREKEGLVEHQYWERERCERRRRPVFCTDGVWQLFQKRKSLQCGCCLSGLGAVIAVAVALVATGTVHLPVA